MLRLEDIYLSYAGGFEAGHPLHGALASLEPGDRLQLAADARGLGLFHSNGLAVARLSRQAELVWRGRLETVRDVRVVALLVRRADPEDDAARREQRRVAEWEVPLVEVTHAQPGEPGYSCSRR